MIALGIGLMVAGALLTNMARDPPTANIGIVAFLLGLALAFMAALQWLARELLT